MNNKNREEVKEIIGEYLFDIIDNYSKEKYGDHCKIKSDGELFEILENEDILFSERKGSSRWYEIYTNVVKIKNTFILFDTYNFTGDTSQYDMDLDHMIDSVCEAQPEERRIIVYKRKES